MYYKTFPFHVSFSLPSANTKQRKLGKLIRCSPSTEVSFFSPVFHRLTSSACNSCESGFTLNQYKCQAFLKCDCESIHRKKKTLGPPLTPSHSYHSALSIFDQSAAFQDCLSCTVLHLMVLLLYSLCCVCVCV